MARSQDEERNLTERSDLSNEIRELIDLLQLSTREGQLLMNLADRAVTENEADPDAIKWLDREVRNRYPSLWKTIAQRTAVLRQA